MVQMDWKTKNSDEMGWRMTVKWDPYAEDDGVLLQFWVDEEMKMAMDVNGRWR